MRADERQAARAYAYAWWMTGDEDAAGDALGAGLSTPEPDEPDDSPRFVALMQGVRAHLGDLRTMPPSSEMALLHDGFGVPLSAAADLAGVPEDTAGFALAAGRLEALLETVREDFAHADRLGGLAVGDPDDAAHASQCRSCGRALTLIERGRAELREVAPVSAPAGMLARMVADAAPAAPAAPVDDAPPVDAVPVEAPPAEPRPAQPPPARPRPAPEQPEQPERRTRERVPMSPARKTVAALLAAAGVLTAGALLMFFLNTDPSPETPVASGPTDAPTPQPSTSADPTPSPGPNRSPFEPPGRGGGFEVTATGLLLPGEDDLAPAGASLGPQDPIRIAVDYVNGSKGVELSAVWRVDDDVYERLRTVVSGRASRHVWGLPVPSAGWPTGRHRISVTTDEGLVGAIDFTIE